jgi:hypothetical protein
MTEESGFNFRQRESDFSFLQNVQTGDGAHLGSYTMRTGDCLPRVKHGGGGGVADHSPPSSAAVKTGGTILSLPHGVVLTQLSLGLNLPYLTSFSLLSFFLRILFSLFPSFVIRQSFIFSSFLGFLLLVLISSPALIFHTPFLLHVVWLNITEITTGSKDTLCAGRCL